MYAWIFRHLPGPLPVRVLLALALLAGVVLLLMEVVFPAVEPLLPWSSVSVDAPATPG